MSTKAYYYRLQVADPDTGELVRDEDGKAIVERVGPLPADGEWPANYAARGLFLQPPREEGEEAPAPIVERSYCPDENCEFSEGWDPTPDGYEGFTDEELVEHARELHSSDVYRGLEKGDIAYLEHVEPVNLKNKTRPELNEYAASVGIHKPEDYPNIGALIEAIENRPPIEEEVVSLRERVRELEAQLAEAQKSSGT